MKVTIKEKEITLKSSFRALIAYEQITNHTFNPSTITDMILYFYCVIISSKEFDEPMTFDDLGMKAALERLVSIINENNSL